MAAPDDKFGVPIVTATVEDEYTLIADGAKYIREDYEQEVLLQPVNDAVAPRLRCSNCHFTRQYTYWYRKLGFIDRTVNYCPGCGYKILGVVGRESTLRM